MYNIVNGVIEEVTKSYVRVKASDFTYYFQKQDYNKIFEVAPDGRLCYQKAITDGEIVPVEKKDRITFAIRDFSGGYLTIVAFDKTGHVKDSSGNIRRLTRDIVWSENDFQLGASLLFIPPVNISVERMSSTQRAHIIRSKTSVKQQSGHTDTKVTLSLYFSDPDSINDPKDGLRGILAQFMRTPFVPVVNTFLNDVHNIQALCLHDITVFTVPNFPGSLQVNLTCFAFDHKAFMPQEPFFINTIDADLFEWYISREADRKDTRLRPITGTDSSIRFYCAKEEDISEFMQKKYVANQRGVSSNNAIESLIIGTKRDLKTIREAIEAFEREFASKYEPGRPMFGAKVYNDPKGYFMITLVGAHGTGANYYNAGYTFIIHLALNNTYGLVDPIDEEYIHLGNKYNVIMKAKASGGKFVIENKERYIKQVEDALRSYEKKFQESSPSIVPLGQEWELPLSYYDIGNVIVTNVAVSCQNVLSRLPVQSLERPAYQFLGSQDAYAQVTLEVLDNDTMSSIVSLFEHAQHLARKYRTRFASSFLRVENEVLNLMGMSYVLIDSMSCTPVPNFPGRYVVELNLIDFDLLQAQREQSKVIINTDSGPQLKSMFEVNFDTPGEPLSLKSGEEIAVYWGRVNKVLKQINVYPDLDLPTYDEVNSFLASIGRGALPNPNGNVYVDPDFYFTEGVGEGTFADNLRDVLNDPPSVNLYAAGDEGIESETVNPGQYPSWYNDEIQQGTTISASAQNWSTGFVKAKGAEAQWRNEYSDELKYNCNGRMLRAFPVIYAFLVDEGARIRWHKLWDNLYGLEAITSVEIVRSRKIAADTAVINISNIYRGFTDMPRTESPTEDSWFKQTIWPSFTEDMKEAHNKISAPLGLFPGARLHIRMGYGNNLSDLPIVFNGTVTEVDVQDVVTLVAQSDAIELTNLLNFKDGKVAGFLSTGAEPKNLLEKLMMWGDNSAFKRLFRQAKDFIWGTKNPIVHFGSTDVRFVFSGSGEIGQNIYPGNGTGFKEGQSVYQKERTLYCSECARYVVATDNLAQTPQGVSPAYVCPNGHTIQHDLYDHGGDEPNIEISLYGKTVWDIAQILASAVPNYIASVQPFDFRSTLFYGKPWWDIVYGYEVYEEKVPGAIEVKGGYWLQPKTKPFMQFHTYNSYGNIIDNRIKASSDGLFTNVIVQMTADQILGKRGTTIAPVTVFADKDIDAHIQRTTMIDSHIYSKAPIPFDPLFIRVIEKIEGKISTENHLWSIGASAVRDYLKDMYRGELIVFGDPTVKPYDSMYLCDVYNEMFGTCFVDQVIHTFSAETGFVTTITPDAAVMVQDHEAMNLLVWLGGVGATTSAVWAAKGIAVAAIAKTSAIAGTAGAFLAKVGAAVSSTKLAAALAGAAKGAGAISSVLSTIAGVGALPISILAGAAILVGWCLWSDFERYLRSAQCVSINLLSYKGKEFSAGINGHRGITVGAVGTPRHGRASDLFRNMLPPWVPFTPSDEELKRSPEDLFGPSLAMSFKDEVNERIAYEEKGLTLTNGIKVIYKQGRPYPATPDDEELLKSFKIKKGSSRRIPPGYGALRNIDHLDVLALAMIMEVSAEEDYDRLLTGVSIINKIVQKPKYKSVYAVISEQGRYDGYQRIDPNTGDRELGPFFDFTEVSIPSIELALAAIKDDTLAGRCHVIDPATIDPSLQWLDEIDGKAWVMINGLIYAYDKKGLVPIPRSEMSRWISEGSVLLTREELARIKNEGR